MEKWIITTMLRKNLLRYQVKNYGLGTRFDLHHDTRQLNEDGYITYEVCVFVLVLVFA